MYRKKEEKEEAEEDLEFALIDRRVATVKNLNAVLRLKCISVLFIFQGQKVHLIYIRPLRKFFMWEIKF